MSSDELDEDLLDDELDRVHEESPAWFESGALLVIGSVLVVAGTPGLLSFPSISGYGLIGAGTLTVAGAFLAFYAGAWYQSQAELVDEGEL